MQNEDWFLVALPVTISRNLFVVGTADRPVTLDMGFAREKVRLSNGVTLTFIRVVVVNTRMGSLNQIPGLGFLMPLPPGETAIVRFDKSGVVSPVCFPVALAQEALRLVTAIRAAALPGANSYTFPELPPQPPGGCSNATNSSLMDRCYAYTWRYVDVAVPAGDLVPGSNNGSPISNGYVVHLTDTLALCASVLPEDCIARLGPLGCLLYTYSQLYPPLSPDAAPKSGSGGGGGSSGGPGGRRAMAIGLGCGLGGLSLLAILTALLIVKRRWQRWPRRQHQAPNAKMEAAAVAVTAAAGVSAEPPYAGGVDGGGGGIGIGSARRMMAQTARRRSEESCPDSHGSAAAAGALHAEWLSESAVIMVVPSPCVTSHAASTGAGVGRGTRRNCRGGDGNGDGDGGGNGDATADSGREDAAREPRDTVVTEASVHAITASADAEGRRGSANDEGEGASSPSPSPSPQVAEPVKLLPTVLGKGACGRVYEGLYRGQKVAVRVVVDHADDLLAGGGYGSCWGAGALASGAVLVKAGDRSQVQPQQQRQDEQTEQQPQQRQQERPQEAPQAQVSSDAQPAQLEPPLEEPPRQQQSQEQQQQQRQQHRDEEQQPKLNQEPEQARQETQEAAERHCGDPRVAHPEEEKGDPREPADGPGEPCAGGDAAARQAGAEAVGARTSEEAGCGHPSCQHQVEGGACGPGPGSHQAELQHQLRLFASEVSVLGRCDHPNVVRLLAACLTPPRLCLVMERCETSLERMIYGSQTCNASLPAEGKGPALRPEGFLIPLPKLLHIGIQICQGLEYLHPTIVHRDLKPANVLVNGADTDRPVAKLADYGLSRIHVMAPPTMSAEAATPSYVAPECFELADGVVQHHADMYALGVLLWAMLTGEVPWKNLSMYAVAYKVAVLGERLPLDHLPESRCAPKLRRLIQQCWEADPRRRPAAAEAVKQLMLVQQAVRALPIIGPRSGNNGQQ